MRAPISNEAKVADAVARCEIALQKLLLKLEEDTGKKIDQVSVDTQNFANLNVEIFLLD